MTFREEIAEMRDSHKFDGMDYRGRRRAAMLYLIGLEGGADEAVGDQDTFGYYELIGKHVVSHDSQGFVAVDSFPSGEAARKMFEEVKASIGDYMEL